MLTDKLSIILQIKNNIKAAIIGKGGYVSDKLIDYPDAINNLPGGVGNNDVLFTISGDTTNFPNNVDKVVVYSSVYNNKSEGSSNQNTSFSKITNITSIPDYKFYYWRNAKSLIISEGIRSIGEYSFYGWWSCLTLTLPNTLEIINDAAFSEFEVCKNLIIPDSVTTIGNFAFEDWTNAETLEVGKGVTQIGEASFTMFGSSTIKSIKLHMIIPPNSLGGLNIYSEVKIQVPLESIDAYKSAFPDYEDRFIVLS